MTDGSRDPQPYSPDDPIHRPSSSARVTRWRCPNCGQTVFQAGANPPPDFCAYCSDLTTWQPVTDHSDQQGLAASS